MGRKKSAESSKASYILTNIGAFQQISDKIIVSDPIYVYHGVENCFDGYLVIENVLSGSWNIIVSILNEKYKKNAELVCLHESIDHSHTNLINMTWTQMGGIGVDSGQAGIYDLKHYQDNKIITKNLIKKSLEFKASFKYENPEDIWCDYNSNMTLKSTYNAGSIPYGVVSSAGYGDGCYDVYTVSNRNGKIIGVKIVFINCDEI
jgi:hypothetical protein